MLLKGLQLLLMLLYKKCICDRDIPSWNYQTILCFGMQCVLIRAAFTRSWEKVVAIFVERHGHDAVGQIKGLLYTVTMVNVNVNVKNSGVVSEKHKGMKTMHTLGKRTNACLSYFSSSSMLMTMSFT